MTRVCQEYSYFFLGGGRVATIWEACAPHPGHNMELPLEIIFSHQQDHSKLIVQNNSAAEDWIQVNDGSMSRSLYYAACTAQLFSLIRK